VERSPDVLGPHRPPPLVVDPPDVLSERLSDLGEALPEVAGHRDNHAVAWREQVGDGRFEPAGPGRGEDQDVVLRPVDLLQAFGDLAEKRAVPGPAVVDEGAALGEEDFGRYRRRPG